MVRLTTNTVIDSFVFDFVTEVEIRASVDELTTTGTLTIPKKINYKRNGKLVTNIVEGADPLFKRGSKVSFSAGYDDNNLTRFTGYISDISPRLPLEFQVQDEMFQMKQRTIKNYYRKSTTLKALLTDLIPDIPFQALDVTLGWIRVNRSTVAGVLNHLRDKYGLTCRFQDGILYAGLRYITTDPLELTVQEFRLDGEQCNVIDGDNLIYRREDDVLIKLKAVSINQKNEKIEIEVGDDDGEQRTMYFYNVSEKDLKTLAEESLKKLRYEGFAGSFLTFLSPQVKPGEAVKLISERLPEKDGVYLVKGVRTTYGVNGGRQEIELDRKVA